jgi:YgiT-type zinc finger domain-containing protein
MKRYCPGCDKERETEIVLREEAYSVKGKWIIIKAKVRVCTVCGEDVFDEALDNATLKRVFQAAGEA